MNINKIIEREIEKISYEIKNIYREFHKYPELSEKEFETMKRISSYLNSWDIENIKGVADTGVIAIVKGGKGPKIAIRADIDALPIEEETGLEYSSKNKGVMHACGHDFHIAVSLGLAKVLKAMEDKLQGEIIFFFQPAEETIGGAKRMIDEGYLKDVDYSLSIHADPAYYTGQIAVKHGQMNAATQEVNIKVIGQDGHGAYPENTIDPVMISAYIITGLQSIISRELSPNNPGVITIGQIEGGTKHNIIPKEVNLRGTIRALDDESLSFLMERVKSVSTNIARAYRAEAIIEFGDSGNYPALVNDDLLVDNLIKIGGELLGEGNVKNIPKARMGGDDFSYFTLNTPGLYYRMGVGYKNKTNSALHTSTFEIDEKALDIGINLLARLIFQLEKEAK